MGFPSSTIDTITLSGHLEAIPNANLHCEGWIPPFTGIGSRRSSSVHRSIEH